MKKLILLVALFCSIVSGSTAQQSATEKASADSLAKVAKAAADKKTKDSLEALKKIPVAKSACDTCPQKICDTSTTKICKPGKLAECGSWWLVYTPVILFLLILIYLLLNLQKFDLKEALTENEYVKKTIANPEYKAANIITLAGTIASATVDSILPPTIEITDIPPTGLPTPGRASSSRFIALVTSLLTLIIAVSLCSFFIYFYIVTGSAPDIGKFSSVLITLGIGVVPYAFNKIAAAISNNKSTTND